MNLFLRCSIIGWAPSYSVGRCENFIKAVGETCWWKEPYKKREAATHTYNSGYVQASTFCRIYYRPIHGALAACVPEVVPKHVAIHFPGQDERRGGAKMKTESKDGICKIFARHCKRNGKGSSNIT
uniref:Uncharacterized protein n=1 Tax=Arundo donax TaxID=35708 RepID=A0A0A9F0W7_ARUDO